MYNWKFPFPHNSKKPTFFLRYYFIGWLYQKPSRIILNLIKKSSNKKPIVKFLNFKNGFFKKKKIKKVLGLLNIQDEYNSLPSNCINYKRYFFLNELFRLEDYKNLVREIEAYPKGRKFEQAEEIIFHTNLSVEDLIKKIDTSFLENNKNYFHNIYNIEDKSRNINEFKQILINRIIERNEGRHEPLRADPEYWMRLRANDGDYCDSTWEVNIDNFLDDNKIPHKKPKNANYNEYYNNTYMYPDWVIDEKMIELFGATYIEGYLEKMEYKIENNKMELISINEQDYNSGNWRNIIRREFNHYFN